MPLGQANIDPWSAPTATSPFHEALGAAINAYYGPQEREAGIGLKKAETNSKNAYANFTPAQIAATLMGTQAFRDTSTPESQRALASYAQNQLNRGITNTNNQQQRPSLVDRILNSFSTRQNNQPQQQQPQQNVENNSNQPQTTAENNYQYDSNGNNIKASPEEINQKIKQVSNESNNGVPDSRTGSIENNVKIPGSTGSVNAASLGEAGEARLKSMGTEEGSAYVRQWNDTNKDNSMLAKESNEAIIQNNNIADSYDKLGSWESGKAFGSLPSFSTEADNYDRYMEQRAATLGQGLSSGNMTKDQHETGIKLKTPRNATKEAVHDATNFDNALRTRNGLKQPFYAEAQSKGLTVPETDTLWGRYIQKPFWDSKKKIVLEDNFDYSPFMTPEWISYARNPHYIKNTSSKNNNNNNSTVANTPHVDSEQIMTWNPSTGRLE